MAKVTLTRTKQFAGSAATFTVMLNGNDCGKIKGNETKTFEIEETIKEILLDCKMSNTKILTNIETDDEITLSLSAMSGKMSAISKNGLVRSTVTKMNKFQYVYLAIVFVVFFILGFVFATTL